MKEKKLLFSIDGYDIYSDSIYTIRDKEDLDAPTGFIDAGTTKLPSAGVTDSFTAPYDKTSEVWDTGFYEYSPCYSSMDSSVVKMVVQKVNDNLVIPFCRARGLQNIPDQRNNEFWDKQIFSVFSGLTVNTSKPDQLMNLYFALLGKHVVPLDLVGDSRYNRAAYTVSDINKNIKVKYERLARVSKAIGAFEQLLSRDKKKLISIMAYNNVNVADNIDDDTFRAMFHQHIDSGGGTQNAEIFLDLIEEIAEEGGEGEAKVNLFMRLKEIVNKGNLITRANTGIYFYNETEIGPDLKSAAENIAKNKNLSDIKRSILIEEDDN